jgi:NAD(P)-dependent dehydrogenase (short-subunit alcohol dehydrogenase family)
MLEGRVVIVTGGGRGLGRSHCLEMARLGAIVVVNDAGVGLTGEGGNAEDTAALVARIVDVHLEGTLSLTKHACDHWRSVAEAGGAVSGRIVNTTSGAGLIGNPGSVSYGSAKAAVAALTMIVAMEMEPYGVTANAISPLAQTRMTEHVSYPGTGDEIDPARDGTPSTRRTRRPLSRGWHPRSRDG